MANVCGSADGDVGRVDDRIFWQVDYPDAGQEVEPKSKRQLADDFEAVLTRAVERRLRADVPVVSYLSGGVDSSVVVALGTNLRKQTGGSPIPTFTIQVDAPGLDETSEAGIVAHRTAHRLAIDTVLEAGLPGPEEVASEYASAPLSS